MLANTTISFRIYALVGMLLFIMAGVAGYGILQMSKIGSELEGIAELDMPLTEKITSVAVHQLEQAVLFERSVGMGKDLLLNPDLKEDFTKLEHKFIDVGHKVEKEIVETEEMLAEAISRAHTEGAKKEFEHLLAVMKKVDKEHKAYEKLAKATLKEAEKGVLTNLRKNAAIVQSQEEKIGHQLVDALKEIEKFTEQALLSAEHDEQAGIRWMIISTVVAFILGLLVSYLSVRSTVNPIRGMTRSMGELAKKDYSSEIPGRGLDNEIGQMADAVQVFKENMIQGDELAAAQKKEQEDKERRAKVIDKLLKTFNDEVDSSLGVVAAAATEMQSSSRSMSKAAENTSERAGSASAATEQAAANVQSVATATEELTSSVGEINRQVNESERIGTEARDQANKTNVLVTGLSESVDKISQVVDLINDIADQTNLLALNATIEAARAGEAGKGFAVVASEVKNLASQTGKATEEIGAQISNVQNETQDAVTAINSITAVIDQMSEIASTIASAMEEQGAATGEIARNVQEAAAGTHEVSQNVSDVNNMAVETKEAANAVLDAAGEVSEQAETLAEQVNAFLAEVRET